MTGGESPPRESAGRAARVLLWLIRGYQLTLSTVMGKQCRFYPSCSHYTADAIRRHGAWRGAGMGIGRILRCNPWNRGGYDPVPENPPAVFGFFAKFSSQKQCACAKHNVTPPQE